MCHDTSSFLDCATVLYASCDERRTQLCNYLQPIWKIIHQHFAYDIWEKRSIHIGTESLRDKEPWMFCKSDKRKW